MGLCRKIGGRTTQIEITSGPGPEWVPAQFREAWVGLKFEVSEEPGMGKFLSDTDTDAVYAVETAEALEALRLKDELAYQWYGERAGKLPPYLLFAKDKCRKC